MARDSEWEEIPVHGDEWEEIPAKATEPAAKAGPAHADEGLPTSLSELSTRLKDPQRWKAILTGKGPSSRADVVQGDVPMALPGGAIPKLTKAAVALAEGSGLGYSLGRTALSAGQGAVMSAADTQEGESAEGTLDRMKSGATLSGGIQLAAESVPVVGKALGVVARKVGSALSGVDEALIQNYAARTDEVNELIKQSGSDVTAAADQVRTELSTGIQKAKGKLNAQISQTLEAASPEPTVSIQPILDHLEAAKGKLNPNLKADAIADIEEMIAKITAEASQSNADGLVNVSSLYQIKQYLNEGASSAYNKGGQIFTRASEAARAAKDAANEARAQLKPVAGAISEADSQLSRLHSIEKRLNKNLLAPGKPDGALMAAGAGSNARNAANLRALEEVSGVPVTQRAKDLATARDFANPSLIASGTTGKVMARMAAGAGLGYALDGNEGAMVGGAVASPMALKTGINALNMGSKMTSQMPNIAKVIRENPTAAHTLVQLLNGQIRKANQEHPAFQNPRLMQKLQEKPELIEGLKDEKLKEQLRKRLISEDEAKKKFVQGN